MESAANGESAAPSQSLSPTPRNLIGLKIRSFREGRKWSQADLAAELRKMGFRISRDIIASIETQRSPVTDWQLVMFARVFAVSFDSFFPDRAKLDQVAAELATTSQHPQKATKERVNGQSPVAKSAANWKVCEFSCKSLKVVLRRD
jgi:transcriptional regulator with XRE-family HTH domain